MASKFSHQHYQAVADIMRDRLRELRSESPVGSSAAFEHVETIGRLASMFADDNPSFKRATFLAACGINPQ